MKDPRLQGTHKGGCKGKVCDGSCGSCGADFIAPRHIVKARPKQAKPKAKAAKK